MLALTGFDDCASFMTMLSLIAMSILIIANSYSFSHKIYDLWSLFLSASETYFARKTCLKMYLT